MLSKRIKDVHRCLKHIDSFSNQQASVIDWDSDMLRWMKLSLKPNGGPYIGGRFVFQVCFGKHYPKVPPVVSCLTPMYHPNIDSTCEEYNVCLSLLDEWQETFGLEDLIQGLLFLLYHPNLDDPLSPLFEGQLEYTSFERNVRRSLQGKTVMGFRAEKMIDCDDDEEDDDDDDDDTGEGLLINDTVEENCVAFGSGSMDNIVEDIVQGVLHKLVEDEQQNSDTVVNAVDTDNADCMSPAENKTLYDDVGACLSEAVDRVCDAVETEDGASGGCGLRSLTSKSPQQSDENAASTHLSSLRSTQVSADVTNCTATETDRSEECGESDWESFEASDGEESDWGSDGASGVASEEGMAQSSDASNQASGDGACGGTNPAAASSSTAAPRSPQQLQRGISSEYITQITQLMDELLKRARRESTELDTAARSSSSSQSQNSGSSSGNVPTATAAAHSPLAPVDSEGAAAATEGARFLMRHSTQNERTESLLMVIHTAMNSILPASGERARRRASLRRAERDEEELSLSRVPSSQDNAVAVAVDVDAESQRGRSSSPVTAPPAQPQSSPIPIPDILEQVEAMLRNIDENGEPEDENASDSDTYFTDDSFDGDEDEFEEIFDFEPVMTVYEGAMDRNREWRRWENWRKENEFRYPLVLAAGAVSIFCRIVDFSALLAM